MSRLYISNQMETLCGKLATNLNPESGSIFNKTRIITQGGGMNNWLTGKITETNGIFAHYEFQNQDGFLGQVYELLTGDKLLSNRDAIKFGVYRLLDTKDFKKDFHDEASYYKDNDLRRIQLSEKIADLFDQYQLYREEMIRSWDAGETYAEQKINKDAEGWQMWLWLQLGMPSKASLKKKIYEKLKTDAEKLKQTWPEIHLFGISIYTSFHLEFYKRLSEYIIVHFYLCLPSEEKEQKHSLLESFGTKAKELLEQFDEMKTELTDFPVTDDNTLLGRLQSSIVNNKELKEKGPDDSIQVTSHFTPVREVEALYNYLLDLFEKDGALKPRDVLVITPDINKYEPFIRAVFRNAPVKLPQRISGAVKTTGDSITASLELISNMSEEDLTAENVVGLLEQNRIGRAYRIEDTSYIRGVINKAGIRFGRSNRLVDDTHFVSWKYGLEKIILGYAMLTEEAFDVSHRLEDEEKELLDGRLTNYPYKDAEASASHDLLRLKAFVDDLQSLFDEQKTPRTLAEWKLLFLESVLGKMVWSNDFDKEDRLERNEIFRALGFTERLDDAAEKEEVTWQVFLNELKKRLFTESREHELNTGSITFTSAIPARGLPYKIIAFIGLDNGVFPRQDQHLGFDLMDNDYQPGDRSKKEADKSLFLDTLMSAREKLYLSYIGQNVKDNTEIPPSIVLDTLMDYLDLKPTEHPLHGFSNRYQKDNKKLFTYLYNTEPDPNVHKTKEPDNSTDEKTEEIWVNDFVKFFEAPIDWYFNKVLGIKYDGDEDDTLPDTELFELNNLQKWQIKNELLKYEGTTDEELNAFIQEYIKKGQLPLKNLGRKMMEELLEQIEQLKTRYQELTRDKQEESMAIDIPINLKIEDTDIEIRITGTIDSVFDGNYIYVSTSKPVEIEKFPKKHKIRAYLKSLLLCASGHIKKASLIALVGKSKKIELFEEDFPVLKQVDAYKKLAELTKYILIGKNQPLIFSLKALDPEKDQNTISIKSVIRALKQEAKGDEYSDTPPNKYVLSLFETGYFENICEEDLAQINEIEELLNLSQPKNEEV